MNMAIDVGGNVNALVVKGQCDEMVFRTRAELARLINTYRQLLHAASRRLQYKKMPGGNPRPLKVALATTYKIPQLVLANTNVVLRIHLFHFTHTFHGHGASDLSVGGIGQGEEVFDGCARPRSPRHLSEDNVVIVSGKVLRSYASRIPRTPKTQLRVAYYQLVG